MEKYIIILVILATIYFIQNKLKETDGFEDAETKEKAKIPIQNMAGIDDTNAINTLAQISRQLMAGGLIVPGDMIVQGNIKAKNLNLDGLNFISGTASPDMKKIQWGDGTGWRLRFQKDDKTPVMDIYDNSNVIITGTLTNTGNGFFGSGTSKVQIGHGYRDGGACIYATGNDLQIGGSTGKTLVEGALFVGGRNILAELDACVKYTQQFRMNVTDNRGGASGPSEANMVGACGGECGGGARIVSTSDPNRQLGFQINKW